MWPPPDPDRMPLPKMNAHNSSNAPDYANASEVQNFRLRQQKDQSRWDQTISTGRYPSCSLENAGDTTDDSSSSQDEAWRNSEGERLGDYGVDEDVEDFNRDETFAHMRQRRRNEKE